MKSEHKARLEQAKAKKPEFSLGIFNNEEVELMHDRLVSLHNEVDKMTDGVVASDGNTKAATKELIKLNNTLVKLIQRFEAGIDVTNLDEIKTEIKVSNLGDIKLPDPAKFPEDLAKDASVKALNQQISALAKAVADYSTSQPQPSQDPEGFMPFRRVRMQGGKLVFDDKSWAGASGSGGSSAAGTETVQGVAAASTVLTANPVTIGGLAKTAEPTSVTDGQVVNVLFAKSGKQITRHALREMQGNQQTSINASVSETTIVTADATYKLDLYGLVLTNTSATTTKVTIKDSTAGTTRFVFEVPSTDTRGFMLPASDGHVQSAANANWTATCGTSVATLEVTALFAKSL